MVATTVTPSAPPRERRVIERPRLTKILDECEARVILLLAPAGYGKTTLARQWVRTLSGALWVTATPAHRDVVTLSEDIAAGVEALGGNASKFIREYLSAQSNPQRSARGVASALADQINKQRVQWLVIDDYHELSDSSDIDSMITVLQDRTQARFLVLSRTRPSWATTRRVLYAELSEIGRDLLAMDPQESFAIVGRRPDLVELLEQARGWPAVLALASRLGPTNLPPNAMPQALHQYVADELFNSASKAEQTQLVRLALLPDLARSLVEAYGAEEALGVVRRAQDLGFLTSGSEPELHPLLREFLLEKLEEEPDSRTTVHQGVESLVLAGEWDQAMDLAKRFGLHELIEPVLVSSYKPLLRSGRLGSLARFATKLRSEPSMPPVEVDLIDAELALRDGAYSLAYRLASDVHSHIRSDSPLRSRVSSIAGGAAFQLADYDRSERAFEEALVGAVDEVDINDALHGLTIAAIYGERPSVDTRIEALGDLASRTRSPLTVARYASAVVARMRIGEGFRDGPHIEDGLRVLDHVSDPRARASVLLTFSYALGLQCEYTRALAHVDRMIAELDSSGYEFAKPHAQWNLAFVKLGLRRFHEADLLLNAIQSTFRDRPLGHHALNVAALRGRMLMQLARPHEGLEQVKFDAEYEAAPSMHGEYLATRAIGLALVGSHETALEVADRASVLSIASEVQVLARGARAIVEAAVGDADSASGLIDVARGRMTWDPVICCVRASPELAACFTSQDHLRPTFERLYRLSNDRSLARKAGFRSQALGNPTDLLTPREAEVLELMAQGFRNREIAEAFFISQSTVKIHVRNVLRKLGVESRTQAVTRYQATR